MLINILELELGSGTNSSMRTMFSSAVTCYKPKTVITLPACFLPLK